MTYHASCHKHLNHFHFIAVVVACRWCYPERIWNQSKAEAQDWLKGSIMLSFIISFLECFFLFQYFKISNVVDS